MKGGSMAEYANPDVLVDSKWIEEHLDDPSVRLVCCDRSVDRLESPLIPGSMVWSWNTEMQQPHLHDIPDKQMMEGLLSRSGIAADTTVVLYGGSNNWYAAFAFWLLKIYGHGDMRIIPGGSKSWQGAEKATAGDPLVPEPVAYQAGSPDWSWRARHEDVARATEDGGCAIVDVRSPPEYNGEVFAPQTPVKFGERAGRIPKAVHVPCALAVNEDGTFKSADDLRAPFRSGHARRKAGSCSANCWGSRTYGSTTAPGENGGT
jgi:thiosulfate/3-mercaptopyruvate sulfurtransferase